ncbi:hypothetical protein KAOT1_08854 [Kordia algicida OT-1]|uniref:Uncharacterized protein n=1 Tax=Kordia algicida OT-1 TaxID=391587 RepID=A9E7L5_9FLAO|nr:hypothetical protein KAOT1_08854 [Kordia algicida OT-1]
MNKQALKYAGRTLVIKSIVSEFMCSSGVIKRTNGGNDISIAEITTI